MYSKRIIIFIIISTCLLLACLLRLIQMQLLPHSSLQDEIANLKEQEGQYRQLKTVRGKILDRKKRILANDEAEFELNIKYSYTCFMDERVQRAKLLLAAKRDEPDIATFEEKKRCLVVP